MALQRLDMRNGVTPRAPRWLVAAILVTSAAVIALNRPASAASQVRGAAAPGMSIDGLWDAVIVNGGGQNNPAFEVPFRFEIATRSEEHTSELQSHVNLVCRLLL